MADRLNIRAELMFGRTSSQEDRHEIAQPSTSELRELFHHFARYGASILTVERLGDPGEGWLQATRRLDDKFQPGPYQLDRTERTGGRTYRVVINSASHTVEMVAGWAQADTIPGAAFGGIEWELPAPDGAVVV